MLNDGQRQQVHIFDSFFCEALDRLDEARIVRWLRGVNIFEKDYLLIPAMIDEHWFLIVIQDPGAILTATDSNSNNNGISNVSSSSSSSRRTYRNQRKRPRIIIMDSMPGHTKEKKPQLIEYLYNFIRLACLARGKTIYVHSLRKFMPSCEHDVKIQVIQSTISSYAIRYGQ